MTVNTVESSTVFLKKSEVAKMFSVTERTIETWMRAGEIPSFRISRSVYFDREAIIKHIRDKQQLA
jgi:excisionase family DNA binding protein